jgi:choline dehydrogenase-like flavoprotein
VRAAGGRHGRGRLLGHANVVVADASIMPTIPRANANLTVAAIAERIAECV